jgi:hypothetical protein
VQERGREGRIARDEDREKKRSGERSAVEKGFN